MSIGLVVALVLSVASCSFVQKHPAVTAGLVTGAIAFGACGVSVEKAGTCSLIGAGAGVGIGGLTGLVTLVADTSAHDLEPLPEEQDEPVIRRKTHTAPPPGLPPGETEPSTGTSQPASPDAPAPPGTPVGTPPDSAPAPSEGTSTPVPSVP